MSRDVLFEEEREWNWSDQANGSWINKNDANGFDAGEFEVNLRQLNGSDQENGSSSVSDDVASLEDVDNNDEVEFVGDDNEDEDHTQPRRSTRASNKPSYLDDYIMIPKIESEHLLMIINDEPWDFNEAKKLKVWIEACKDEIFSIEKNNTWDLVELPAGVKPIGLKWVFKIKCNADGTISKYKARLVAKGYVQRHGVDYDEVFAPVARIETIRLIVVLAGTYGWEIHHLDVKTVFLHGELMEEVYVSQPEEQA